MATSPRQARIDARQLPLYEQILATGDTGLRLEEFNGPYEPIMPLLDTGALERFQTGGDEEPRDGIERIPGEYWRAVGRPRAETEIGAFRREFLAWLSSHEAWQMMPAKQRGVMAGTILRRMNPENGLYVGQKRMRREAKGRVSESTVWRARKALRDAGLLVAVKQKRPNGSQAPSAWYPATAFYISQGLPVPAKLAEHLGWGVVRPIGEVVHVAFGGRG